jgi:hypothetical protein
MTVYELIFILLFLGSLINLFISVFLRKRGTARKILVTLISVWSVYLVILAITDVLRPQKVFKIGEPQCFDEMCFAVADVQTMPEKAIHTSGATAGSLYIVTIRVTNRSRGRAQAEGGLRGRLYMAATDISMCLRQRSRPMTLNMVEARS